MGCDIHLYVEVFKNGKWVSADSWQSSEYAEEGENKLEVRYEDRFYSGRNYNLFSILADVRNGHGFAGVKTGEGFNPISDPRGLPADVCNEISVESDGWGEDGHSHSWLTVRELMDYDWTQVTKQCGWVNGYEYFRWSEYNRKHGESPEEYSGGVSGGMVKHISQQEMDVAIDAIKKPFIESGKGGWYHDVLKLIENQLQHTYCSVEWKIPYYKTVRSFLSDTLPRLWRLGNPEAVRIVFWFDN